jgi:hypothetical protein
MSEDRYISLLPFGGEKYQGRFNRAIVPDRGQYKIIDSAEVCSFSHAILYNGVSEKVVNALKETAEALTFERYMGADVDFCIRKVDKEVLKNF